MDLIELVPVFLLVAGGAFWAGLWAAKLSHKVEHPADVAISEDNETLRMQLQDALENIEDGFVLYDAQDRLVMCNNAYRAQLGAHAHLLRVGSSYFEHTLEFAKTGTIPGIEGKEEEFVNNIIAQRYSSAGIEKTFQRHDGHWIRQRDKRTVAGNIVGIRTDITELKKREQDLEQANQEVIYHASHDALTGVANRSYFSQRVKAALEKARSTHGNVGLLHIDLDKFKAVNDTFGHAAGDAVLSHAAQILQGETRREDLVSRVGGDEFVILCPEINDFEILTRLGERIIERLSQPFMWQDCALEVSASVGCALSARGQLDVQGLMHNADIALYDVKNSGRNGVQMFDEKLAAIHLDTQKLERELMSALDHDQIIPFLQPIVNLDTNECIGAEILTRWHHPERGVLLPGVFFEAAEKLGVMAKIDEISLHSAFDTLERLKALGVDLPKIAINVCASTLTAHKFIDRLKWELEGRSIDPNRLVVEILETTFFADGGSEAAEQISRLSELGVHVVLDDFGVGYAGLSHLAQLQIDGVKLDRSLLRKLPDDAASKSIVVAVAELCRELGLFVSSEGIESNEQIEFLRSISCPVAQGFGIARPMPIADFAQWMQSGETMQFHDSLLQQSHG